MTKTLPRWILWFIPTLIAGLILFQLIWQMQFVEKEKKEYYIRVLYVLNRAKKELKNQNSCVTFYSKPIVRDHEALILIKQKWNKQGYYGKPDTTALWLKKEHLPPTIQDSIPLSYPAYQSSLNTSVEVSMQVIYNDSSENAINYADSLNKFYPERAPINHQELYHFLKTELQKEGIQDSFGFGFRDLSTKKIRSYFGLKDSNDLHNASYSIDVFQNEGFLQPQMLSLVFYSSPHHKLQPTWAYLSLACLILLFALLLYFYRFYKQQQKLSQLKSDFMHNMNHEMKTPITNIKLAIETLRSELTLQPLSSKLLDIAEKEANRLQLNVDKTLQLGSIESHSLSLVGSPIAVKALIQEVIEGFQPTLLHLKTARVDVQGEEMEFITDRLHFFNILSALLDNAIKYRKPKEALQVVIRIQSSQKELIIEFADNGMGMKPEVKQHIFEKFYRAETGLIHNTKGFGLGLNYVHTMLAEMQGTIQVESAWGIGTTFTIKLPRNPINE